MRMRISERNQSNNIIVFRRVFKPVRIFCGNVNGIAFLKRVINTINHHGTFPINNIEQMIPGVHMGRKR